MAEVKKPSITKATIKLELIKQITLKRADIDPFLSMIDDYASLWSIKNQLMADIRKYGAVITEKNGDTKIRIKNNPSVKELVGVNKQMLSLLKELGLSTANVGGEVVEPL